MKKGAKFLILIGIIFLVVGCLLAVKIFDYEDKIETTGIITEIIMEESFDGEDVDYDVYVSYEVDGEQYESVLNSYASSFYEGKEIEIYYDKNNPEAIGMKSLDLLILMVPGFGIIFTGLGIGLIVKEKLYLGKEKRLKENGKLVYANYIQTIKNTSFAVNGQNPYNIICEWNDETENRKYEFKSKNIWMDPEPIITEKNITTFPVYINLENKKDYIIDISAVS